jgi:hypothetical protein
MYTRPIIARQVGKGCIELLKLSSVNHRLEMTGKTVNCQPCLQTPDNLVSGLNTPIILQQTVDN